MEDIIACSRFGAAAASTRPSGAQTATSPILVLSITPSSLLVSIERVMGRRRGGGNVLN